MIFIRFSTDTLDNHIEAVKAASGILINCCFPLFETCNHKDKYKARLIDSLFAIYDRCETTMINNDRQDKARENQ